MREALLGLLTLQRGGQHVGDGLGKAHVLRAEGMLGGRVEAQHRDRLFVVAHRRVDDAAHVAQPGAPGTVERPRREEFPAGDARRVLAQDVGPHAVRRDRAALAERRVRTFALRRAHQVLARRREHLQHADRVHALAAHHARGLGVELLGAVPVERKLAEARDGFLPFGVHAHVPLRALAFADVLGDAAVAGEAALGVVHRVAARAQVARLAILAGIAVLEVAESAVRREGLAVLLPGAAERRERQLPARLALRPRRIAVHRGAAVHAGVGEAELGVLLPVPVGGQRGQAAEAFFAFAQCRLGKPTFGDVLDEAFQGEDRAILRVDASTALPDALFAPVRGAHPVLEHERRAVAQGFLRRVPGTGAVLGMHQLRERHAPADEVLRRIPGERARALADELRRPVRVVAAAVGHAGQVAEQRGQPPLVLLQRAHRLVARRHVLGDAAVAEELAVLAEDGFARDADVVHRAVVAGALEQQVAERHARRERRLVLLPAAAQRFGARQLPAPQAVVLRGGDAAARVVRSAGRDEAQLGVLFPVPVRRQVRQAAEARLACPGGLLRQFALQELADLAADGQHRLQQALVRLADLAPAQRKHADGVRLHGDGKHEGAAHFTGDRAASLGNPRVRDDVFQPERGARPPDGARQSRVRAQRHAARCGDEALHLVVIQSPALGDAQ